MSYTKQGFADGDVLTAANLIKIEDGIISAQSGEATPDYVRVEAERVAKLVQSRQGANTITFIVCSDVHYSTVNNASQMRETLTHMGQAMRIIRENVSVDFAACLGDAIWDGKNESVDDVQQAFRDLNESLFPSFNGIPDFRLVGNHEVHYNGTTKLTEKQIFGNRGLFSKGATFDPENRDGGYFYYDFTDRKLRVVCLNTSEGDVSGGFTMSSRQLSWLASALNLSSLGSGWRSLILSHIPLDWYGAGSAPLSTIKAASGITCCIHGHIHNYLTGELTGTGIQRIAIPNGCFYRSNEYGENGTTEYNGMEFGETTTYDKTAGTAQDTAFCVVTIDLDESMVYADHYGAGYDRAVSFDGTVSTSYSVTYSLTNVTSSSSVSEVASGEPYSTTLNPKSGYELSKVTVTMGGVDITSSSYLASKVTIGSVTDSVMITAVAVEPGTDEPDVPYHNLVSSSLASGGGSVYNVTGYKDGYRLNSSGAEAELANATITGFIPYNGEVVRVYGSTRDGSESGQYLVAYDSNFKHIYSLAPTNSSAAGLSYQKVNGKYLLTYDVSKETTSTIKSNFESAAYIRASCAGCKGADLIVTLDEPIE